MGCFLIVFIDNLYIHSWLCFKYIRVLTIQPKNPDNQKFQIMQKYVAIFLELHSILFTSVKHENKA